MTGLLLDTCAVIWLAGGEPLALPAAGAINEAAETGESLRISPISAWELGILAARGRLASRVSPRTLLGRLLSAPGMRYADMPPDVLIESSHLPGFPPRDPADRIVIATAREYGLSIVTRDRLILDYAERGHVAAIPC